MKVNKLIDHTYLKAFGTKKEIDKLLHEAKEHDFKSVCVNPTHVSYCAKELEGSDVLVCTVIGFPLGANTVETKVFETLNAVSNGADEIDMVINIGRFLEGDYDYIEDEINQVCKAAMDKVVKVIVEICYLTDEQIKKVSEIVAKTKATFIKKDGEKLIFTMSCVEKKQGRTFRLELNYQYDQNNDKWSIYSGKL